MYITLTQVSTPIHLVSDSIYTVYHVLHTLTAATNLYASENNNQTTYWFIKYVSAIMCIQLAYIILLKLDIKRKHLNCSMCCQLN